MIAALVGAGCGFYVKGYRFAMLQDLGKRLSPEPTTIHNESFPPDPDSVSQRSPIPRQTTTVEMPKSTAAPPVPADADAVPLSPPLPASDDSEPFPESEITSSPPVPADPGLEGSLPLPSPLELPPPSPLPSPELADPPPGFMDPGFPPSNLLPESNPSLSSPNSSETERPPQL